MKKLLFIKLLLIFTICFAGASEITTMNNFDSKQYLGTWYEIARLPNVFEKNCIAPVTANYSLKSDKSSQLIVENSCNTNSNEEKRVTGTAFFIESSSISKLKVNFLPKLLKWIPFSDGDYWVIYTNYTDVAVVGSPDHKYLWILARSNSLKPNVLDDAITLAKSQGFDTSKLIFN
jgi:apolipoprotein D and lipocalin family protein